MVDTEETKLKALRTYKGDLEQVVGTDEGSLVGIASAESIKRYSGQQVAPTVIENRANSNSEAIKKIGIVILSTILVVLGVGSAFYFYGKSNSVIVNPTQNVSSFIFVDENYGFDITDLSRRQILNELTAINNSTNISLGRIRNVFITESFIDEQGLEQRALVNASDFLKAIDAQVPASFLRSLSRDFMVGVHVFNGNQPFIILSTGFYENAFVGMLEWERYLKKDLTPFFGEEKNKVVDATQASTTVYKTTIPIFSDVVLKNKDVRVLKDDDGKIILLYSFVDQNTIVITTNESTFSEVLSRYTSSRTSR